MRKGRKMYLIICLITIALVFFTICFFQNKDKRSINIYLIPNGFVGWIEIEYGQSSYPIANKINDKNVFEIPSSGVLRISNKEPEYGWAEDEYYFVDSQGNKIKKLKLNRDFFGKQHEESNGQLTEKFFVGDKQKFNNIQRK